MRADGPLPELNEILRLDLLSGLFLVFLAMRLSGTIDWSWFWIFAPLAVRAPAVVCLVVVLALAGIQLLLGPLSRRRR